MRCSSAGWLARSEEECKTMAHATAAPTHNSPEGIIIIALDKLPEWMKSVNQQFDDACDGFIS